LFAPGHRQLHGGLHGLRRPRHRSPARAELGQDALAHHLGRAAPEPRKDLGVPPTSVSRGFILPFPSPASARMPLDIALGYSSLTGPRPRNEDYCGFTTPEGAELENKGLLVAVADGVGGHAMGREASEFTVRGLLSDYYATPDT